MIPKECKRLAEVDFPIAEVSKHSAREKSIRHGHPSTLHLWWARRPLSACRAMLLGLLWPDPGDPRCPENFKQKARALLPPVVGEVGPTDEDLRRALLKFIGDFANWDNASRPIYLEVSRELVKAAHLPSSRQAAYEPPLVVDPFAGGGSIPLEALRLGCEAFASDLNPVACLILKVMLEDIPREAHRRDAEGAESLADELRRVGKEIKEKAELELKEFYPDDPDGSKPIAYLWARTVRCESPNCGAEIPLMRSFWLCKKPKRKIALRPIVHRGGAESAEENNENEEEKNSASSASLRCKRIDGEPYVEFEIFEPKSDQEVPGGTVTRAKATCLCCGTVLPPDRVRAQLAEQRGGADVIFEEIHRGDAESAEKKSEKKENSASSASLWCKRIGGARLLAVVTLRPGEKGRHYRLPTECDYLAVWNAQKRIKEILDEWERGGRKGLCPVPDEPTPAGGGSGAGRAFSVQKYGMMTFGDLFTARQKVALIEIITEMLCRRTAHSVEVVEPLALAITRLVDYLSAQCVWHIPKQLVAHTFGRQALPITWDFCEIQPTSAAPGNFEGAVHWIAKVMEALPSLPMGSVQSADACAYPLPDAGAATWFTDPPYYDAIPYSDLSDFFLVWLKRTLKGHPLLRDPFDPTNSLSPKTREVVQDETKQFEGHPKDRTFFENAMGNAFAEGRRILNEDGIGSVVFAHKTTEGWEALLSGMIRGGWTITGSWPIATEMEARLRARDSAALATSVHLVCRPRPDDAPVGDWADVLRELPNRVGDWMERLQGEGIRGADLVFACIGPALEIFSRHPRVETAEGREVELAEYLEKVWEVVGRTALGQVLGTAEAKARNGAAGAVEEDARLTALFLWTLQSTDGDANGNDNEPEKDDDTPTKKAKGFSLVFDVVRRFAQPLGIDLPKWEGRIIETKKGVVRLMAVSERAKQLFGEDGADAVADWIMDDPQTSLQQVLFPELEKKSPQRHREHRGRKRMIMDEESLTRGESDATTLDRVHAAMLLQSGGQANALRALIQAETKRSFEFLRLANALSALYPKECEEKRLLDAMLLAVPR